VLSIVAKNSIYKLKANRFEPEKSFSPGERLRKLLSIEELLKKRGTFAASLLRFPALTVFNTVMLGIGIIAPICWVIKLLYWLGLASFNPELYHVLLFTVCSAPLGILLALCRIPERAGWFVVLMGCLFAYGAFLPIIIGALCTIVIQLALSLFLGREVISKINGAVYLLLTGASLIYGIYLSIETISKTDWEAPASTATDNNLRFDLSAVDEVFGDSDGDPGGDGGGDGGD
jgi:hypothetical protein